ncbi:unnamed protein product (macronuclear) [Paramecium tetraurelia]|uniref:TPX2 central domain-containing protein n=1 Tax=Paramecium tetraurelia TaxID=5888 RepID=A0CR58_PARTE|nr:uncharacterized protein GSPATT00009590001 [Paramecium tetraurelia]CAK73275.1 unnamed protein product [Paramecium tetraurelia]|eukprot:XP_001440672.1 hypothetical protein (macronuclear) [Paramecium tetraurelia strain d4-2]
MRNYITITQDNNVRQYPRLLANEGLQNQMAKFKKIENEGGFKKKVETNFVLKSLHKMNHETHSFRLIKVLDTPFIQRRKSECDGVISEKIQNIDMKYPKTTIGQHQFLDRVKDLRRKAIKGRMKNKFQKSFRKIDTTKPSQFNHQPHYTMSKRDSTYGSLQEIKVLRPFARDRAYYQRTLEKKGSDSFCESPSTPNLHIRRRTQKIGVTQNQKQFVLLQLNKFSPKNFEQIKKDSILKILSETKESQSQTHVVPQPASIILNKFQPYICNPKIMNLKKCSILTSSSRVKTLF